MKFRLRQKPALALTVCICLAVLFSCHRLPIEGPGIAAAEIIKIVGSNAATDDLILRDINGRAADTFTIGKGKHIQWLLSTNAVKDITNIYKKPTSENVFSTLPHRLGSTANWAAKIKFSARGKDEDYNIDWTDAAGNTHTYDPKIQVR